MAKKTGLIKDTYSLSERASSLRLMSRTIAKCLHIGNFKSLYKGRGIDYAGTRDYLYGDDVRAIDWNVTARMSKPYIKLFEEDRELILFLIVDRSASMETGLGKSSRLETATEAAALMLFAAMQNASPLGGVLFSGETDFSCAPKIGKDHAMILFSKLDARPKKNTAGTSLTQALRGASTLLKNRALVLIFSDFRCEGYEKELSRLATKHDVIAIRVRDEADKKLPLMGMVEFFDPETKKHRSYPTNASLFQQEWKEYHERHVERWQSFCAKRGIEIISLSTEDDPSTELIRFFSARSRK